MPTRTLVAAVLATGCHAATTPAPTLHDDSPASKLTRLDPLALRGAAVDHVARLYDVAVAPDGVTMLIGSGVDCTRELTEGWSLSVSARAGEVRSVELMWCGDGTGADLASATRQRLGEPSSGACWNVCSWTSADAFLAHHSTRTASYDVLILASRSAGTAASSGR